ncbi:hypothetical protein B0H19DRAFT_1080841 [Mycena capillaripes]|nr:hypothetical protein B0H19DRAFT_1080841 [Mycena capillaripes]
MPQSVESCWYCFTSNFPGADVRPATSGSDGIILFVFFEPPLSSPWLLGKGSGRCRATKAHLDFEKPMRRDVFTVPARGWAVARIVADNAGYWSTAILHGTWRAAGSSPMVSWKDELEEGFLHGSLILSLASHEYAYDAIRLEPRARRVLEMAWKHAIDSDRFKKVDDKFRTLMPLVYLLTAHTKGPPTDFEEIVEGTGGSLEHLASVHACSSTTPSSDVGEFLSACLNLFSGEPGITLFQAAVLVAIIVAFSGSSHMKKFVEMCLTHLINGLQLPPGHTYIVQALDAGLLRCILLIAGLFGKRADTTRRRWS